MEGVVAFSEGWDDCCCGPFLSGLCYQRIRSSTWARGKAARRLSLTGDVTGSTSQCQSQCAHENHISFLLTDALLKRKNKNRGPYRTEDSKGLQIIRADWKSLCTKCLF